MKPSEIPSALGTLLQELQLRSAVGWRPGVTGESTWPVTRGQAMRFVGLEGKGQGDNEGNARGRWRWPVQWKETGNQCVAKPGRKDLEQTENAQAGRNLRQKGKSERQLIRGNPCR